MTIRLHQDGIFQNSFDKDESFGEDDAVRKLYDNLRPGEKTSADTARKFIASRLFEIRRYDLAKVGRYKSNKNWMLLLVQ